MSENNDNSPTIGIDLGTTFSCVSVSENGFRKVMVNESGKRVTPSCVSFHNGELLVGDAAKACLALSPKNTIYDAKRLIGRRFNDAEVQENIKRWPFKVIEEDGRLKYKVKHKEEIIMISPESICSHILRNLKETAERYLRKEVKNAVITVPAYFNDSQRKATKIAGMIAGLNVVRIINEPTAAALAYGLDQNKEDDYTNVLIYDLGGGTFDVTILSIECGIFTVKSTAGNSHLGGQDFTNRLVDFCCKDIKSKTGRDITQNKSVLANLTISCEDAKQALSFRKATQINLVESNSKYTTTITRAFFEELNSDYFESTLKQVQLALDDAKFNISDIDEIVLVGGSTRIPKVQAILVDYFEGKSLNCSLNADEGVAIGAAIQGAIMNCEDDLNDIVLMDVTPLTLGINSKGIMSVIIPRNITIPITETKEYETVEDDQDFVRIKVYEGERKFVNDNNLLDEFTLENLPKGPKSTVIIKVIFNIDVNGILTVSAVETSKGIEKSIVVQNKIKSLTDEEIAKAIEDAERFKKSDETVLEKENNKQTLEAFCLQLISDFAHNKATASEKSKPIILQNCRDTLKWCLNTPDATNQDYERKLNALKAMFTLNVDFVDQVE